MPEPDPRAIRAPGTPGPASWCGRSIPCRGRASSATTPGAENSAKNRSGVNVWGYTSLDAERGILYMPLGAPNNDRVGIDRPGNNLFSSSVVAVDANTGKYLWHFQLVHHDIWDYDTQSAPLLVDLQRDGTTVPAVIIVNKTGLMFTLNRVTGKPIFDIEERPVPKSDVPGEQTSPTQPFPVKPEPLTQNTISRDNLYKGEPQHQSYCEHMVDDNNMKLGGPFMPIAVQPLQHFAAGTGGRHQLLGRVLRSQAAPVHFEHHQHVPADAPDPAAGRQLRQFRTARRHAPLRRSRPESAVRADAVGRTGRRQHGHRRHRLSQDARRLRHAARRACRTRDARVPAASILTASGLTFVGGTDDFRFRAFATATGDKLWEIKLPSSIETTPITYMGADGRQFVTVVSTGGGLTGSEVTNDEIIAFALPKK